MHQALTLSIINQQQVKCPYNSLFTVHRMLCTIWTRTKSITNQDACELTSGKYASQLLNLSSKTMESLINSLLLSYRVQKNMKWSQINFICPYLHLQCKITEFYSPKNQYNLIILYFLECRIIGNFPPECIIIALGPPLECKIMQA